MRSGSFSLPWEEQPDGSTTAYAYEITRNGNGWVLRLDGTLIHIGLTINECKIEADRNRGIGSA